MSGQEFGDTNMNFNALNRARWDYVRDDLEGAPETPYADEVSPVLVFPPGLRWYSPFYGTLRFTVEEYNGDTNPTPLIRNAARHLVIPVFGTPPVTFSHDLKTFPQCTFIDNATRVLMTPTTVTWTDLETITVDYSGDIDWYALVTG